MVVKRALWLRIGTVFLSVLLLASFVGMWRAGRDYAQLRFEESESLNLLSQFHLALTQVHRSIVLLSASRDGALLTAGFSPTEAYQQVQEQFSVAQNRYERLEPLLERWFQQSTDGHELRWTIVRIQTEWRQMEADIEAYLKTPSEAPDREVPNLSTLRALRDHPIDSTWKAITDLQHETHHFFQRTERSLQREFWGFCVLVVLSLVGLLGLAYWRWVYPAQLARRWLVQPQSSLPPALQETEWAPLLEKLQRQQIRLREVEQFLRDWGMGRTPNPLTPESPDDTLARSSRWVMERLDAESKRKAV